MTTTMMRRKALAPVQVLGRFARRAIRYGLADVCRWYWYRQLWRVRESSAEIDHGPTAYGLHVPRRGERHDYEAIDPCVMEEALNYLEADPTRDVFLDYGSGMGRAVILAAARPYRKVLGVEVDERLSEIARMHVSRARKRGWLRTPDVQIISSDATAMPVPEVVTQIFLNNPFSGTLLQAVLERIHESVVAVPRPVKIVHVQRVIDDDPLAACAWLTWECELPTCFSTHVRSVVYSYRV